MNFKYALLIALIGLTLMAVADAKAMKGKDKGDKGDKGDKDDEEGPDDDECEEEWWCADKANYCDDKKWESLMLANCPCSCGEMPDTEEPEEPEEPDDYS